jgi:hypothetical protein
VPDSVPRDDVLAMLAAYGECPPEEVAEGIDSMELAWLIHQIEQRFDRQLDVDDELLARMSTVTGVAQVLDDLQREAVHD